MQDRLLTVRPGIGAAIAHNLASKGCSLLLNYTSHSSTPLAENICKTLSTEHSIRCLSVQADLSDPEPAVAHILTIARNNFSHPKTKAFQIDIMINNAGISENMRLGAPITVDSFQKQYTVNVLAPMLLTQACIEFLPTDRSGRVVNLSSVSSSLGFEAQTVYGGTKAALESMTRCWARELAERCTVNAVNPGPVKGDMYTQAGEGFWNTMQGWQDNCPLANVNDSDQGKDEEDSKFLQLARDKMGGRRPAYDHEIAGVVGMLCSAVSAWCTGSVICCNGGLRMGI